MPLATLLNREVVILRRESSGDEDDYGNETETDVMVKTVGELQQRNRDEQDDQGELSDTLWLLILPAGTDILTGDAVVVDGDRYELVGDPWQARNPRTKTVSHLECSLRRTASSENAS